MLVEFFTPFFISAKLKMHTVRVYHVKPSIHNFGFFYRQAHSQLAFHLPLVTANRLTPVSHVGGVVACNQLRPPPSLLSLFCHLNSLCGVGLQSWRAECCQTVFEANIRQDFVTGYHACEGAMPHVVWSEKKTFVEYRSAKLEAILHSCKYESAARSVRRLARARTTDQFLWGQI